MESLEGILETLADRVGATVAMIGSSDGLVVEQHPPAGHDLAATAAEFTYVLSGVARALGQGLEAGPTREVAVETEHARALVRVVNPDLYLLVMVDPSTDLAGVRRHADDAATRIVGLLS
jgi:predicted regulator of Ras-like GTPase activity (Roadblock/LC7/MglB family)